MDGGGGEDWSSFTLTGPCKIPLELRIHRGYSGPSWALKRKKGLSLLLRVEIENFYSVREKQVLDFRIPRTTPEGPRYGACQAEAGDRAPHVIAIFGANASGKTNFLRAITFLQRFVVDSFDDYKTDQDIALLPFDRRGYADGKTRLSMEFSPSLWMIERWLEPEFGSYDNRLYRYELIIDHSTGKSIVELESLKWSNGTRQFTSIFERIIDGDSYEIKSHKEFDLARSDPRRNVRKNVSLISSLVQFDHVPSKRLREMFGHSFFTNLGFQKQQNSLETVTSFLASEDNVFRELNDKIRIIDVGIEKVEIREINGKKVPLFYHSGLDGVQTFDFESEGTKSFYLNFVDLFLALGSGGIAVMDELDADLHPNLMSEIIRWFQDDKENLFSGQLIMSCHNASVISELEKDEVWLTDKNQHGETSIAPLTKFKGLRRDANLYSKYLSGAFGAIPRFG